MDLGMSNKVKPLVEKVRVMVREEIIPLEAEYEAEIGKEGNRWAHTRRQTEIIEGLKAKARERGLWNFWLTASDRGYGLSTVEYAYLAEEMGWSRLAPETFNCMAPDTGNMEVLERYGSAEHKERWLKPLLEGKIRSAFVMTEPGVAPGTTGGSVLFVVSSAVFVGRVKYHVPTPAASNTIAVASPSTHLWGVAVRV
jgi:acyl-CoA dehydrogenase